MTAHPGQIQTDLIDDLCDATAALKTLSTLMTNRPDDVTLDQDDLHGLNVLFRAATDRLEQVYDALSYEKAAAMRAAKARPSPRAATTAKQRFHEAFQTIVDEKAAREAPVYPILDMPGAEEAAKAMVG